MSARGIRPRGQNKSFQEFLSAGKFSNPNLNPIPRKVNGISNCGRKFLKFLQENLSTRADSMAGVFLRPHRLKTTDKSQMQQRSKS